jgi:hypothetical protein
MERCKMLGAPGSDFGAWDTDGITFPDLVSEIGETMNQRE